MVLGKEHDDTIDTSYYLAEFYKDQNRLLESEQYYKRVHKVYEKRYGTNSLKVVDIIYTLGVVSQLRKRFVEGSEYFMQCIKIYKVLYGNSTKPSEQDLIKDSEDLYNNCVMRSKF